MKLLNKILVIVFLSVFLFSSTGLTVIHHTCDSCGISEILVNTQHEHKEDLCMKTEKSCCNASSCEMPEPEPNQTECCKEDHFYFKVEEPYVNVSSSVDLEIKVIQFFNYFLYEEFEKLLSSQSYETSIIKPPDNSGRDILRNVCVLRV